MCRFTCMERKPKRVRSPEHEASSIAMFQRMLREKIEQKRSGE
jgi:hypothetical protein